MINSSACFNVSECPRECDECSLVDVDGKYVYSCDVCNEGYGRNIHLCTGGFNMDLV